MGVNIGTITVDLIARTSTFTGEMNKASQIALNSSRNIQKSLSLISTAAAGMATASVGALGLLIAKADETVFSMQRLAEQAGTSVESFSQLALASKLAGTPMENTAMMMDRLSKKVFEAASGNRAATQVFKSLGVSISDGNGHFKDTAVIMQEVAVKLDGLKEGVGKNALEMQLFGRSGAEAAALLKTLAADHGELAREAKELGVSLDENTVQAAKRLHDQFVLLETAGEGVGIRLMTTVAPALDQVSRKILEVAKSQQFISAIQNFGNALSSAMTSAAGAVDFLSQHTTALKAILGTLAAGQVARVFGPMALSTVSAGKGFDVLGMSAVNMVAKFSGLAIITKLFTPLIAQIQLQTFMLQGLVVEEGLASAATYAFTTALQSLQAALMKNAFTIVIAGLAAVAYKFHEVSAAALSTEPDGGKWSDVWNGWVLGLGENLEWLIAKWNKLRGAQLSQDDLAALKRGFNGDDMTTLIHKAGDNRRFAQTPSPQAPAPPPPKPKVDAPFGLPGKPADDPVAKKLLELQNAAKSAEARLADAGKNDPSAERRDEVDKLYIQTITELNEKLKSQGKTVDALSQIKIKAAITTQVMADAERKFLDANAKHLEQLDTEAKGEQEKAQAILQTAAAQREANIQAELARDLADKDPEFMAKHPDIAKRTEKDIRAKYDADDQAQANQRVVDLRMAITAQQNLNSAVTEGADALRQASEENDEASIRQRYSGFSDPAHLQQMQQEIALTRRLAEAKRDEENLGRATSFQSPVDNYRRQMQAMQDALDTAKQYGVAIDEDVVAAAKKQALDEFADAVDRVTLSTGSAADGFKVFFSEISRDSVSIAQQLHDVFADTFESLNDAMAKLISGQKVNWQSFFQSIAQQTAKVGLQKFESNTLNSIFGNDREKSAQSAQKGIKNILFPSSAGGQTSPLGNNMGSATNPFWVKLADMPGGNTGGFGKLMSGDSDDSDQKSGLLSSVMDGGGNGFFSNLFGSAGQLVGAFSGLGFGGHRALGGDVMAGQSYDVGEMGRETFVPTQNGRIIPNNKAGGSTAYYSIDARGANEEAVDQRVRQSMLLTHDHAVKTSMGNIQEMLRRRPSSARF